MNKLTSSYLLDVINEIENGYIESAWSRLDCQGGDVQKDFKGPKEESKSSKVAFLLMKRVAIFLGVLILATTTTVVTAMAVNEQFRENVKQIFFELFSAEEEAEVPEMSVAEPITTDNMYVEQDRSIIGDVIEGRYVHAPVACHAREGIYTICTDEIELNQGSHYDAYYEENGEFIKLEEEHFCGDYTILGQQFHIEFDWAAHGGQVALTYIGAEEAYRIPANPGNSHAILIELLCSVPTAEGDLADTAYPVLLNLETRELMDVLAGTGAERLPHLCNQAISEDGTKMLLAQSDGALYYVDLQEKQLYSVEALSGERADVCSLLGDTLACWVLEGDDYRAWSIDLATFRRKELFSGKKNQMVTDEQGAGIVYLSGFDATMHWGTMFTGSHFALETDETGNVTILSLFTGERIPVEGVVWPGGQYQDVLWDASPDGKRLLISGGEIGSQYKYIGVLDFEKLRYLEFARRNRNEVYEWPPYWFDKDTVIIPATVKDTGYSQDYYLYELLDETAIIIEGIVEKVPVYLWEGADYSIAVPEEGWIKCGEAAWESEINETVKFRFTEYDGEEADDVKEKLSAEGYLESEENPDRLLYIDENGIVKNVRVYAKNGRTVALFYQYPVEATEGFGIRLEYIAGSFQWKNHSKE